MQRQAQEEKMRELAARVASDEQWREWTALQDMGRWLPGAVVAIEDLAVPEMDHEDLLVDRANLYQPGRPEGDGNRHEGNTHQQRAPCRSPHQDSPLDGGAFRHRLDDCLRFRHATTRRERRGVPPPPFRLAGSGQ